MTNTISIPTMRAALRLSYGSPEQLEIVHVPKPSPKDNELLIKVEVSSATAADTMIRKGEPKFGRLFLGLLKPNCPITGTGFSGTVEAIGSDVTNFAMGDRLFGETGFNFSSNAEYLTVAADHLVHAIPDQISFEQAAPICDGSLTSWNFLTNIFAVKKGQKLLINGAAGSLGTAAIQIGAYLGADVTAVCSAKNSEYVKSLGAISVIDYTTEEFTNGGKQYDIIFDTVGKLTFTKCKSVLTEHGVYLSPVLSLPLLGKMILTAKSRGKRAIFSATGALPVPKLKELIAEVISLYEKGVLHTEINRTFTLDEIREAHNYIETGHKRGNIVLISNG